MNTRKKPTLKDIATAAGVSIPTVDRVLNQRAPVSEKMQEKVLAAFEQLNQQHLSVLRDNPDLEPLYFDFIFESGRSFVFTMDQTTQSVSQLFAARNVFFRTHLRETFDSESLADLIKEKAADSHGLALICREHPAVNAVVDQVVGRGIPVVCLTTDLADTRRLGYIGVNQVSAGRTAGYLMGRFIGDREGDVILVASAPYRCQEERELGFRRVLREEFPGLSIRETINSDNSSQKSYELLRAYFERGEHPLGIYNVSGGNKGIADAIAEFGGSERIVFIGHELNDNSYALLTHNRMDAVIHHDIYAEVFQAANLLLSHYDRALLKPDFTPLPPIIVLRDNASAVYAQHTLHNTLGEIAAKMAG